MDQLLPSVSVIVPAFGAAAWLGEALASLQAQTVADWEAVVVDDGDAEPVAAAVAPFASDRRIRLLATENGGPSAARNCGIAASSAPYVAMLDGDDRYRPDYLERMAAVLSSDPALGFVTCDALLFGAPAFEGRLFSSMQPQTGPITLERVIRREFNVISGSMVRREALDSVGGYDEAMRSSEDLDLWIRILEAGWQGTLIDEPMVEYRRRPGSLSAASLALARWDLRLYELAVSRLEGRPEQAAARDMLVKAANQLRIEEGTAAILAGRTRDGLAQLRGSDIARASLKWRLAMAAFRLFPPLAGPVMRFYMRGQPLAEARPASARSNQAASL